MWDTKRWSHAFVQAAGLICLLALPVAAEELGNDACLACHGMEDFTGPSGRRVVVGADAFGASVHGTLSCTMCHTDVTEVPHAEQLKSVPLQTCATCHEDQVTAYQRSIHGRANSHGVREAATCHDCHGDIHTVTPHTQPTSAAHWSKLAATCARCHANVELTKKFRIPIVRPVEAYLESAHAHAVAAGKHGAVCSDCHGSHEILPSNDPRSTISRPKVPETCGKCHSDILNTYRDSVHGEALARGVSDAPVCTDCHGEHGILPHTAAASPVFAANIPHDTCGRCHGNERLAAKYGLPATNVSGFEDSFHGLSLRAGRLTVANCASCHGVHDIRPSSDQRSHVNPANLATTCGKCHPGAGTSFRLTAIHAPAAAVGTRAVWWIRWTYLWLIGLTIGMMTVHNLLDLSRKTRRMPPPPSTLAATQPERMPRQLRWQHGLVMVSLPILVYTGFALKYPESWWAAPLLQWESRFALRGLVHRTAALVLVLSLVWHGVHLVLSRRLRACLRGLVPSLRDLAHVGGVLAYYLRLRPAPPHGGAFSYIEKAEYWAFMWGVFVMSITGFMLWFENTTLRYLPNWTADVATAIHFYEAILATLSILVWHFYWVIFDPEVYPMDWSWWDGQAPESRVLERMGAEVENGDRE